MNRLDPRSDPHVQHMLRRMLNTIHDGGLSKVELHWNLSFVNVGKLKKKHQKIKKEQKSEFLFLQ